MGGLDVHLPLLVMIGLQFHYAVLTIFTRAAMLDGLNPTVFVVYRRRSSKSSLGLKSFSLMFVTALIGVTASQNTYFTGLYLSSSTVAAAMVNMIPSFTFVIATILGYEKFDLLNIRSIAKVLGTVCCVGGALIMALLKGQKLLHMEFLPKHLTTNGGDTWLLGCLVLLVSSIFWACWLIFQVPVSSCCPDHLLSTFMICLYSAIQSAIFTLLFEQNLQAWILNSPLQFLSCLYAGIGIAISFFIQTWCVSKRGPLYTAMFTPLITVLTAFIATIFLKEELYIGSVIGAVGAITGLYIVLWGKANEIDEMKQEALKSNSQDGEINNKIDLEEPLMSRHVAESKIEP